ncbi:MAG: hypothetical protein EOM28_05460 [Clostridia bacterium]|nr:hypothetical protein [Clostridia bacterium]
MFLNLFDLEMVFVEEDTLSVEVTKETNYSISLASIRGCGKSYPNADEKRKSNVEITTAHRMVRVHLQFQMSLSNFYADGQNLEWLTEIAEVVLPADKISILTIVESADWRIPA